MSLPNNKPKHIPKRQRDRFHGAFLGGFSAGHFNTVGSKDGWTPSTTKQQQTALDFMDDDDHEEWGGPTSVAKEFARREPNDNIDKHLSIFTVDAPTHVGHKLMRFLGWRESTNSSYIDDDGAETPLIQLQLSKKRVRRIQLQQVRVKIPKAKLDTAGLGFDAYANAPEFRAAAEARRQKQQQANNNVYKVSDAIGGPKSLAVRDETDNDYAYHETLETFVGAKSVGGFALSDDHDDAYDADHNDKSQFDAVAYESESDDDEVLTTNKTFGGVLSSWAEFGGSSNAKQQQSLMTNGKAPLPGFVLGGSHVQSLERFRGPDVPASFDVKRHVFPKEEHPMIWKAIAHAEKLVAADQDRKHAMEKALQDRKVEPRRPVVLQKSNYFVGLRTAMNDRFTPASTVVDDTPVEGGLLQRLHTVGDFRGEPSQKSEAAVAIPAIKLIRTVQVFRPERLLCKRFNVAMPKQSHVDATLTDVRTREERFFQDEVLAKAKEAITAMQRSSHPAFKDSLAEESNMEETQRPSLAVYKSIFESTSTSDEGSSSEAEMDNKVKEKVQCQLSAPVRGGEANAQVTAASRTLDDSTLELPQTACGTIAIPDVMDGNKQDSLPGTPRKRSRSEEHSDFSVSSDDSRPRRKKERKHRNKEKKKRKSKHRKKSTRD
jgi:hypothetical protein